ncbi:MAG: hypothetical protein E7206_17800 [Clostridium beijerinckii]|nr:hypothetical protein [Clostridium beijerinckii]
MDINEMFKDSRHVAEAYKVLEIYEVWIGTQKIKIKLSELIKGNGFKYWYSNSHHYHGSKQASAYISSRNGFNSTEEALHGALRELTSFYDESDSNAIWEENNLF